MLEIGSAKRIEPRKDIPAGAPLVLLVRDFSGVVDFKVGNLVLRLNRKLSKKIDNIAGKLFQKFKGPELEAFCRAGLAKLKMN